MSPRKEASEPEVVRVAPPSVPVFKVAPGTSIVCLRGQLEAGAELSARDFVTGQDAVDELVAAGAVVKS